jgi:hypothetical protein
MKGNKKFHDPSIHVRISRNGRRAFSSIYIHSQNFMKEDKNFHGHNLHAGISRNGRRAFACKCLHSRGHVPIYLRGT